MNPNPLYDRLERVREKLEAAKKRGAPPGSMVQLQREADQLLAEITEINRRRYFAQWGARLPAIAAKMERRAS